MLVATLLTLSIGLVITELLIKSGHLSPLGDIGNSIFLAVCIIAGVLLLITLLRVLGIPTKMHRDTGSVQNEVVNKKSYVAISKDNRFHNFASRVMIIWVWVVSLVAYAIVWFMYWKDGISPLIEQFTSTEFTWSYFSTELLIPTFLSFLVLAALIIAPIMIYLQITESTSNREGSNRKQDDTLSIVIVLHSNNYE